MPRYHRLTSLLVAAPLALLVACGSSGGTDAAATSGPVYGPATPAATTLGTAPADQLPTATGKIGEKPTLTFPSTPPPPGVQRAFLVEGTGPEVQQGDLLVANYYGAVWGSATPFDNSYDKKKAASFTIGTGAVVPGWDLALVGVPVGSRVLLTLSPSDGYGLAGNESAGISGTDTLVFVIDVLQTLGADQFGQADAVVQPAPANAPIVTGAPGTEPSLTIPAGLAEPTEPKTDVLATGTGAPVTYGLVYLQYAVWSWADGTQQGASWTQGGPQEVEITESLTQLAGLIGVPVGSRVLLQLPADAESGSPASAFVIDVLYQAPPVA